MKRARLVCCALMFPGVAAGQSQATIDSAVNSITPHDILGRIAVIAADSMRGRSTPSPGLELTAAYIADQFRRVGLAPAGDGSGYIQRFSLLRVEARYLLVKGSDGSVWRAGRHLVQLSGGTVEAVSGSAFVVGGRAVLPVDTDLDGAVVLVVTDQVSGGPGVKLEAQKLIANIGERNPVAIIVVSDFPQAVWDSVARRDLDSELGIERPEGVPVLAVQTGTAKAVLSARGHKLPKDGDLTVQQVDDLEFTITVRHQIEEYAAPNVVGVLEGRDPVLKNEYVVFSGHMDHMGVGPPVKGDSIYNGADDNASGTIAVVAAAEAFSKLAPRPKRSLIFLTVSAEENGLLGSAYFADNPVAPMSQIVAALNMDMIGRNRPDEVTVIGKDHSDLGRTLMRVNGRHPELKLKVADDSRPEERLYFRSDHYNFARRGVPILFFFGGIHDDYHKPSDEVGKIDADKESRIVKLVFYLGLEIANATERPKWDPASYREIVGGKGR